VFITLAHDKKRLWNGTALPVIGMVNALSGMAMAIIIIIIIIMPFV